MPELFPLFKLHEVDAAMVDAKKRHDNMDPGREIAARMQAVAKEHAAAKQEADRLVGELKDAELLQKSIQDKIAKFDKQLYGGTIISPREVENFQKEIGLLKVQRDGLDDRILELWELVPPAQAAEKELAVQVETLKTELDAHQKKVVEDRAKLAALYKELAAKRPALAAKVDANLLKIYEANRERHGGVGMTEINESNNCARCGMSVPRKTIDAVGRDVVMTCESCHRIFYKVGTNVI